MLIFRRKLDVYQSILARLCSFYELILIGKKEANWKQESSRWGGDNHLIGTVAVIRTIHF